MDEHHEDEPLLGSSSGVGVSSGADPWPPDLALPPPNSVSHHQLSTLFAVACIVDQFGITPVITLPRLIILCGWIGFPLVIVVFAVAIYTAMLLGRCWIIAESVDHTMTTKTRYPSTALIELAWGKRAGQLLNGYINFGVFMSNIPALVIASQNLQSLDSKISGGLYNLSYCYWLIILGASTCPLTWLGSPKDMKWVSVVSSGSVLFCTAFTCASMLLDTSTTFSFADLPAVSWQSVGIAYGNFAFQLACHPAILAIQVDMRKKQHVSYSILASFFVTGGLTLVTSVLAFALYGLQVKPNLTEGLPNNVGLQLNVALITLSLILSTIVGGCALFQDLEEKLRLPEEMCWQKCALRTAIVMSMVFLAEILPRFDLVMGLLGGLFAGPLTLILPPLLYQRLRSMLPETRIKNEPTCSSDFTQTKRPVKRFLQRHFFSLDVDLTDGGLSPTEWLTTVIIVILGVFATVTAIYFSFRGAVWSSKFVPPCFFDVEAASRVVNW